jgi:hypothetical protein
MVSPLQGIFWGWLDEWGYAVVHRRTGDDLPRVASGKFSSWHRKRHRQLVGAARRCEHGLIIGSAPRPVSGRPGRTGNLVPGGESGPNVHSHRGVRFRGVLAASAWVKQLVLVGAATVWFAACGVAKMRNLAMTHNIPNSPDSHTHRPDQPNAIDHYGTAFRWTCPSAVS